jgi:hypothetical protein
VPNKVSVIPQVSVSMMGLGQPLSKECYRIDGVATDYIASMICPERYVYRKPTPYPQKTAIASGSTEFILTSDATGNTAFWVNP